MRFVLATEEPDRCCAEYRAFMHAQLLERPYFQATVVQWGIEGLEDPDSASGAVASAWSTLELLFAGSTSCRAFGEDRVKFVGGATRQFATDHAEWPAWAERGRVRKIGLDLDCNATARAIDFLSVALVRGVVPVFALDPQRVEQERLIAALADPFQVTSPFGISPNASKRQIRSLIRRSALVALVAKTAYSLNVEFHGDPALITDLFDRTLTIGRRTAGFERAHCHYHVRPFEVGSTLLWEGVSRKRHGLEVATERLAAAERDPNATERTTPHALAAAELLAALAGRPPQVYTEQEPDLDRRIAAWVEEKRASFAIAREDLALARRALEAIVEWSTFPERRWRTLPPKAKWEQTTRELIDRATAAERDTVR